MDHDPLSLSRPIDSSSIVSARSPGRVSHYLDEQYSPPIHLIQRAGVDSSLMYLYASRPHQDIGQQNSSSMVRSRMPRYMRRYEPKTGSIQISVANIRRSYLLLSPILERRYLLVRHSRVLRVVISLDISRSRDLALQEHSLIRVV